MRPAADILPAPDVPFEPITFEEMPILDPSDPEDQDMLDALNESCQQYLNFWVGELRAFHGLQPAGPEPPSGKAAGGAASAPKGKVKRVRRRATRGNHP
jgi:hypothetical protein